MDDRLKLGHLMTPKGGEEWLWVPAALKKLMTKILTHEEYENRMRAIRTPEDMAAFAQELIAPMLEQKASSQKEDELPTKVTRRRKQSLVIESDVPSPWYDVVADDNEAMIVDLYAKGMTTRDIAAYMKVHHGLDISQPSISAVTDKVYPLMKEWQARPLASSYPIVYLDGLRFKVRDSGKISPKVAYIAMGISQYGEKEVLGIWTNDTEGSKFWMHVLTNLKNRGVEDIFIACVDGLKGFPEAIKAIFPLADVQVCIAHQIRHTIMFLPHKDRKLFCSDLKAVYTARLRMRVWKLWLT